ncbi:MAG: PadR family transcriptional regulator [Actinomycetota bacterium]
MAKARSKPEVDRGERLKSNLGDFVREGPGKRFIEPRILFLLNRGPGHGYDLIRRMDEVDMPGPMPDTGAVYRKLRFMEEEGLVESHWEESSPGPQRRVYRITGPGRDRLATWAEAIRGRIEILRGFLDRCEEEL